MIRVLIADDHGIVREGLKRIVGGARDMQVVAEAANGHEALERARREGPDVVVLDVSMPGRGGLETLKDLKSWRSAVRVLVLSMHPEDQFGPRFLREGADGYMTKESAPELLLSAIRKVHAGGKYLSPVLAEKLAVSLDPKAERAPHERLSDREFEVMRLIASGRTVSEIGDELALSVKTVSTYRVRIREKMGLKNNAEIMHYAMQQGLV
jgi:two-component system, NarL family, invasion response regulator UvrY